MGLLLKYPPAKRKRNHLLHLHELKIGMFRIDKDIEIALCYNRRNDEEGMAVAAHKCIADLWGRGRVRKGIPVGRSVSCVQCFGSNLVRDVDGHHYIIVRQGGEGKMHRHFSHCQRSVHGGIQQFNSG